MNMLESPDIVGQSLLMNNFSKVTDPAYQQAFTKQEMSPLFRKAECQVLIGSVASPHLHAHNINNSNKKNNWSANPSAGPSPHGDRECQSFSTFTKNMKHNRDNSSNSPCISQDASPQLYANRPAGQTPNNGIESWASNFTSLVNATAKNNNSN